MHQTNAHDYSISVSVCINSVAALELEFSTENRKFPSNDSSDRDSFADLSRVADRLQTTECSSKGS
eukprot:2435516-Pyramimonas_sp.AAC.2